MGRVVALGGHSLAWFVPACPQGLETRVRKCPKSERAALQKCLDRSGREGAEQGDGGTWWLGCGAGVQLLPGAPRGIALLGLWFGRQEFGLEWSKLPQLPVPPGLQWALLPEIAENSVLKTISFSLSLHLPNPSGSRAPVQPWWWRRRVSPHSGG